MIISVPAAVGISVLGPQIIHMLFPSASDGGTLLTVGGVSIIFLALCQTSTGILQGIGHIKVPVVGAILGAITKVILNVTAELQKDVQYGTLTVTADVDGAWVYINGEEYGVAPMQVNLPYGSYNVMLEKSGYQSYKQSIQISSQTAAIHATME